jgi:hypothetical protein
MFEGLGLENVDIHFMIIWNILRALVIFYEHLVQCLFFWYIFYVFGIVHQKNLATL